MTTRPDAERRVVTVRELGGEIWSEFSRRVPQEDTDWKTQGILVDILMGVLARHTGEVVENDEDLPVKPL